MEETTTFVQGNDGMGIGPQILHRCDGYRSKLGQKNHAFILEDYADFYGLSSRRLRDHITEATTGRVLGITRQNGQYRFHGRPEDIAGPIPDQPTVYLMPKSTKSAAPAVCANSPVSSHINMIEIRSDKAHPTLTISADRGFSGPVVCLNCRF